jgi:hypothetical protein
MFVQAKLARRPARVKPQRALTAEINPGEWRIDSPMWCLGVT